MSMKEINLRFILDVYTKYKDSLYICLKTSNNDWMLAGLYKGIITKVISRKIDGLSRIEIQIGEFLTDLLVYLDYDTDVGDCIYAPMSFITFSNYIQGHACVGYTRLMPDDIDKNPSNIIDYNLTNKGVDNLIVKISDRLGFIIRNDDIRNDSNFITAIEKLKHWR